MTPPMDHEAKARELAERGWLGEWEYEEEREDAIHEVATALREERDRVLEEAATLCMKGSAYLPTCCSRECYENSRVIRALKDKA